MRHNGPHLLDVSREIGLCSTEASSSPGAGTLTFMAQFTRPLTRSVYTGPQVGTLLGNVLSGYFLAWFEWETTFYVYGALGLLW